MHHPPQLAALSPEARTRLLARAAMRQRLEETIATPTPDSLAWLRSVCEDLKARIGALTPSRADLCEAWERGFDVDLLVQMVEHAAADPGDVDVMISLVFDRLQLVCAPVQDDAVAEARRHLHALPATARKLASLVDLAAEILADVEDLLAQAQRTCSAPDA